MNKIIKVTLKRLGKNTDGYRIAKITNAISISVMDAECNERHLEAGDRLSKREAESISRISIGQPVEVTTTA